MSVSAWLRASRNGAQKARALHEALVEAIVPLLLPIAGTWGQRYDLARRFGLTRWQAARVAWRTR